VFKRRKQEKDDTGIKGKPTFGGETNLHEAIEEEIKERFGNGTKKDYPR